MSEGHGNSKGLCTEEGWGLTRVGYPMAWELGAEGQEVGPVRESGEIWESQVL